MPTDYSLDGLMPPSWAVIACLLYTSINVPVKDAGGNTIDQNYYKIPVNYRLPDGSTNQVESLYKLERNRLYDIRVNIDKAGDTDPHSAVQLNAGYTIQDWSTHEVLVSVEGINFIYVKDTKISMPNNTQFTTTFQSSTDVYKRQSQGRQ